jgi:tetratricopeptide (TPR) repeat protein
MLRIVNSALNCSAITVLAFAVTLAAQAPETLQRARGLLEHGQAAEAGHILETFLRQHPRSADGWTLLGVARAQQNEPGNAEECFHKALVIQPHLSSAQTDLGHLLLSEHRGAEALPYLSDAMRSDRGNSQLRDMLVAAAEETALQQRASGDRNGALATLLAAKTEAPHDFHLLLDLSILEDEAHLLRDAERDVAEARAIHPGDLKALYAGARVKMDLQDMPAAERDMRAYLMARPEDATAHYGLGRILQITQRSDEAKAEFERSIALAPNRSEARRGTDGAGHCGLPAEAVSAGGRVAEGCDRCRARLPAGALLLWACASEDRAEGGFGTGVEDRGCDGRRAESARSSAFAACSRRIVYLTSAVIQIPLVILICFHPRQAVSFEHSRYVSS